MTTSPSFPAGWGVVLAPGTRRIDPRTLVGGAPVRVLRLSARGGQVLDRWIGGGPVGGRRGAGALARRLTDGGVALPVVPIRPVTADDGVAVVIPVHDRAEGLLATLLALRKGADPAGAVELIVVDDGSSDAGAVAAAVRTAGVEATIVHRGERGGPAAARNSGWRAAGGRTVVFLDADCTPEPGWLAILISQLDDPSLAAVAPRVVTEAPDPCGQAPRRLGATYLVTRIDRYEAARSPLDLGPAPGPVRPGSRVTYLPSAALAVRRAALEDVGGFDEALRVGEDVDLVWRLVTGGWRVRYEPSARVGHPSRPSLGAALRQRYDYGTSAQPLAARHGSAVAPLALPWASGLAWAGVLAGPPALAVAGAVAAVGWSARRIRERATLPGAEAVRLGFAGHVAGGLATAEALRRTWWPLAVAGGVIAPRRSRRLAAFAVLPLLVEWQRAGRPLDPLRWVLLRLADDVAYGSGVWAGCWRGRSAKALLPRITR